MVYGEGIRSAEVTTDYAGVKVDSIVRLDSPNYLLVYLNLEGAQPGEMTLNFKDGKSTKKVKYQLKAREKRGEERMGFTNADVLYMLMPDRFADGDPKTTTSRALTHTRPTVRSQVFATVATLKAYVSTSTTSPNWALRPCGLRPFSRTTRPTITAKARIMATLRPTITV